MPETIESLLAEGRTFPPPDAFKKTALVTGADVYDEADADFEGFWARQADALDWFEEWHTVLEWDLPFAKWFVGGKLNVVVQLPRPPRRQRSRRPGRVPLGGRTRRHPHDHVRASCSPTSAASPTRSRASASQRGDRVCIYLGDGARAADGAARVRADRRAALRRVRRVLVGLVARSHPGRRGQGRRHRRRRVAARPGRPAQADDRHRGRGVPVDREGARAPAHRAGRRPDDERPRRLVARRRADAERATARPR